IPPALRATLFPYTTLFRSLLAWIATLPEGNNEGWVFPSERIVTPLLPGNVLRRCIHPRLKPLGLDWINFAVLRRSHSTLHQERRSEEHTSELQSRVDLVCR